MRSLSPRNLEANVVAETLKKVVPHSVAVAFAKRVFPVPGGPKSMTPRHGRRIPLKKSGMSIGRTTASLIMCLAS